MKINGVKATREDVARLVYDILNGKISNIATK